MEMRVMMGDGRGEPMSDERDQLLPLRTMI